MIRTASSIDISSVSPTDIGRAHKVFGPDNKPFYMVQSSRDSIVEYKVTWHPKMSFQCRCPAGQEAFIHCKDVCQHVKIALAAAQEEREALAVLRAAERCLSVQQPVVHSFYTTVDQVTLARIEAANERASTKPVSRAKANSPRGFSLLKV